MLAAFRSSFEAFSPAGGVDRSTPVSSCGKMARPLQLQHSIISIINLRRNSLFKEVSPDLGIHGAQRVVQQVDVCVLIHGPEDTLLPPVAHYTGLSGIRYEFVTQRHTDVALRQQNLFLQLKRVQLTHYHNKKNSPPEMR